MEQRVEPDVGVGPGVERTVAELGHLRVQVLRKLGDLGLGDPLDAHGPHEIVDPTRRDAFDVGLADHRGERLSARRRGSKSPGKYEPRRSFGISSSTVPALVSQRRLRCPFRLFTRASERSA